MSNSLIVIDNSPISVGSNGFVLEMSTVLQAVERVNAKFRQLQRKTTLMALNVFETIDFRMLSGLVGEVFVSDLSENIKVLIKNPIIDGYPDLLNASETRYINDIHEWLKKGELINFIKYPYGGLEVKNTFGTKKGSLLPGETRIGSINRQLSWKAHHRYTNNLLALFSDYIDGCPQIVAVMYSDCLSESDWKNKQNPKDGSTMTSFSVTEQSGWQKLKTGLKLCRDDELYLKFFGQGYSK